MAIRGIYTTRILLPNQIIFIFIPHLYIVEGFKICSKCGLEKPLSRFYKDNRREGGYRSFCIECCKKYYEENKTRISASRKQYRIKNADKIREYNRKYVEEHKDWKIDYDKRYYAENAEHIKHRVREYSQNNLETVRARHRKWRKLNPDKVITYRRKYHRSIKGRLNSIRGKHRRRCREITTESTLTDMQWNKILDLQRGKCSMCKKQFSKSNPATVDHIIPVSKGGGLTFENVQALCKSCNCKKNDKLDMNLLLSWL